MIQNKEIKIYNLINAYKNGALNFEILKDIAKDYGYLAQHSSLNKGDITLTKFEDLLK